ncbi:hypothetical protein Tco_0508455 [Tanacetum coccineum]
MFGLGRLECGQSTENAGSFPLYAIMRKQRCPPRDQFSRLIYGDVTNRDDAVVLKLWVTLSGNTMQNITMNLKGFWSEVLALLDERNGGEIA